MEEKLFLVDDQHYLHVQECDEGGYDYTFYDKETYEAVDGGRMDEPEEWGITTILQAAEAICYNHGLTPEPVSYTHLDVYKRQDKYTVSIVDVPEGYLIDRTAREVTVPVNQEVLETFVLDQESGATIRVIESQTGLGVDDVTLRISLSLIHI